MRCLMSVISFRMAPHRLPNPHPRPAQRLLGQAGPQRVRRSIPPFPGCNANRRMRTRTSGGVGGAGVSPAPTRSIEVPHPEACFSTPTRVQHKRRVGAEFSVAIVGAASARGSRRSPDIAARARRPPRVSRGRGAGCGLRLALAQLARETREPQRIRCWTSADGGSSPSRWLVRAARHRRRRRG